MKVLLKKLIDLKKVGAVAVKQSLEDEGASFKDLVVMREITKKANLALNVKIGGCEAINDIMFCSALKVDGMVSPMVESEYGLKKFIQSIPKNYKNKLFVNLESKNSINNFNSIIKSSYFKKLSGVVIGRSDLVGSYGFSKDKVDSIFFLNLLSKNLKKIKNNILIKVGGSVTPRSRKFLAKLYENNLISSTETRNIEFKMSKKNLNNFNNILKKVFEFEIEWLKYKNNKKNKVFGIQLNYNFSKRIKELKKRKNLFT
jgi:hypothetical protein